VIIIIHIGGRRIIPSISIDVVINNVRTIINDRIVVIIMTIDFDY